MLIERAFGKRRMFADSPTAQSLGFGVRVGDPALALLKPDARLDPNAERLLRADFLRRLPDPTAEWNSPNGYSWIRQGMGLMLLFAVVVGFGLYTKRRAKHS